MKNLLSIPLCLGLALIIVGSVSAAKPLDPGSNSRRPLRLATGSADATNSGKARSAAQACLVHEAAIQNRAKNVTKMALNMQEKFASISARVEEFYNNKVVPSGNIVPNYSLLLSNIASSSGAVNLALNDAQTAADDFSCNVQNPKTQLRAFHQDLRGVITALKDYRRSVRDLIVAVHKSFNQSEKSASSAGGLE